MCIFVPFTIAKFHHIVSCSTNSHDYVTLWRKNRSQIFEALTINPVNPENSQRGKGGMRQWQISWAFFKHGTVTEKHVLLISRIFFHYQCYPFCWVFSVAIFNMSFSACQKPAQQGETKRNLQIIWNLSVFQVW